MISFIWKIFIISLFLGITYFRAAVKNIIPNNGSNLIFPRVSVIFPVYNTGNYLSHFLNSLLNQTPKEIEIILC